MRHLTSLSILAIAAALAAPAAQAQSVTNLAALKGLEPVSVLGNTPAGKAALEANYKVTGAIQNGTFDQPALQPFPQQQAQALSDAFITLANGAELADGLGTKLGAAYQAKANYTSPKTFTSISPEVANLLVYSLIVAELDSNAGKFFFANGTSQSGKNPPVPASATALIILKDADGTTDIFGKAYNLPAGSPGADPYGDSRPFQTEKNVLKFSDPDHFGAPSDNSDYLSGPVQDLTKSPSYPSGHTTYAYTEATLLAIMVPERFPQMVTRAAEYGNHRIIVGAHYAMDVIGGRTLALYDLAQMLSGNTDYLNLKTGKVPPIANYPEALKAARASLAAALEKSTGESIAQAAAQDTSRFSNPATNAAFYESTQTYSLPVVYPAQAAKSEDIGMEAPEAGNILTAAFPYLTLKQADAILTSTEGPGGGFLDNGSHFGVYSRIDLYKAGLKAEALKPHS